jgi:hypothetical protein
MACNHHLEEYLDAYVNAAGIAKDVEAYLCRSVRGKARTLTENPLAQQMAARESRRTTALYDRRDDAVAADEVEQILI